MNNTFTPTIHFLGDQIQHDMPCAICQYEAASYNKQEGHFEPCLKCKAQGWVTELKMNSLEKICLKIFGSA